LAAAPPDLLAAIWGPTSKGRKGREYRWRGEKTREREGGGGEGREGRGPPFMDPRFAPAQTPSFVESKKSVNYTMSHMAHTAYARGHFMATAAAQNTY